MIGRSNVMIMAVGFQSISSVAAIFLVGALLSCGTARQEPPAKTTAPPAAAAAPPKTDTRPVVAAFGDSLSAGLGLDPGKTYPDDLQRLIDAAGFQYRVVNLGVSGDTTTDGVERLPSVVAIHPALVILEFGANDGLRGQPLAITKQNLARMIEALRAANAQVIIAGMTLPRNYGPEYIHPFEQVFVELARQYKLVRIPFLLEGVGGNPALTQPDGLHPTAEGAAVVAQNVMNYLAPLLGKH